MGRKKLYILVLDDQFINCILIMTILEWTQNCWNINKNISFFLIKLGNVWVWVLISIGAWPRYCGDASFHFTYDYNDCSIKLVKLYIFFNYLLFFFTSFLYYFYEQQISHQVLFSSFSLKSKKIISQLYNRIYYNNKSWVWWYF